METTTFNNSRRLKTRGKRFKTRTEQIEWYEKQFGWLPLTDADRAVIDDAVRMVTNFD